MKKHLQIQIGLLNNLIFKRAVVREINEYLVLIGVSI